VIDLSLVFREMWDTTAPTHKKYVAKQNHTKKNPT
jgi:hypothetical protein